MAHTLLVADESITIQRVVDLVFAAQGIKVVAVSDGEQALEYLRSARPDVALISANLQKADGFEVTRFIRSQPSLQRVPVLLMAGAFDSVDDERARAAGAAGVLFKPIEPGKVINRVKELLGLTKPEERHRGTEPEPADTSSHLDEWFTESLLTDGTLEGGLPRRSSDLSAVAHSAKAEGAEADLPRQSSEGAKAGFGPADAFAVLLAEEQGETTAPVVPQPVVELSDVMVERIADRVAERLMQSVFGDSLRGTVHEVSERLVREEIQRIRAAAHTQR